jgi:hypothetical protein
MRALAITLAVIVAGCKTIPTAPSEQQPAPIDCRQHNTADLPHAPLMWWDWPDFLALVIGTLAEERTLRGIEQDCIERHKAESVIR